jgi:predicted transcriptional regulator
MPAADRPFPPPLHELESEVMEEVWRREEANVRAVLDALNAQGAKQRAYTTVMTIMRRLDDKGMLCRRRAGRTDIYEACLSREEYLRARAQVEVDAVVEQYGEAAFVHFARQMAALDPKQRQKLTRLARRE